MSRYPYRDGKSTFSTPKRVEAEEGAGNISEKHITWNKSAHAINGYLSRQSWRTTNPTSRQRPRCQPRLLYVFAFLQDVPSGGDLPPGRQRYGGGLPMPARRHCCKQ